MGVKGLWAILTPFSERRPLYELQGKNIAIDLSGWVCEAQNVAENTIQPRMYLRNLYFRTCYLLLLDVNPVFVLEGQAPELKYKTIAARNALQFKGAKPKKNEIQKGKDRSRFNNTLKLCEQMLRLMGITCLQGEGEAEALCAHLNHQELVDGIISQDSDCFAYGARIVYRNFSISQQGPHASKGGSVEIYNLAKAETNLNFGRNKVIALALLCGSDYNDGVHGIGKDSVLKLFNTISDDDILNHLRSWRNKENYYQDLEKIITGKNICTSCGHLGKNHAHTNKGCLECGTNQGCDSEKFKNKRLLIKNELNMRSKAIADPDFPDESLINEFLSRKDKFAKINIKWDKPDIINFIKFTVKYLTWEEIYSFEKIFPIFTRWQLHNPSNATVTPKCIKKRRNPKGITSYEIIWQDKNHYLENIIPQAQLAESGVDLEKLWSTIEPKQLVEKAYPKLVQDFEQSKLQSQKSKKKKRPVNEISDLMLNISISKPVEKKRAKKVNTLDKFLLRQTSTPKKLPHFSFDLDQSNFGDEDDINVSDIVDNLVKNLPSYLPTKLESLVANNCTFFLNEITETDLFEQTFNEFCGNKNDDSD